MTNASVVYYLFDNGIWQIEVLVLKSHILAIHLLNELFVGVDCDDDINISLLTKGSDHAIPKLCETRRTARVDAVSWLMEQDLSIHSGMCRIETVSSADARTNAGGLSRKYFIHHNSFCSVCVEPFCIFITFPVKDRLQHGNSFWRRERIN